MRATDFKIAVAQSPVNNALLDDALRLVLPILEALLERTKGWKFWVIWGLKAVIKALEEYLYPAPKD